MTPKSGQRTPFSFHERGSALLITLSMIVLITVVVLVFTAQTQLERRLSSAQFSDQKSQAFTQMGYDAALTRIRETLRPFDDPFGNTTTPTTFWSLSPGRIDLFALTNGSAQPVRVTNVALHTPYPVTNTNTTPANLNAPDSLGNRPIASQPLDMKVEWVAVGKNPTAPISNTNAIEGRYAFWVDDEGSKINVNTADGSDNYFLSSYGQGTPTAVSLSVFRDLGDTNAPNRAGVRQLAAEARSTPFTMLTDMAKRSVLTNVVNSRFASTNALNLTTYSRSPDFNIFNQPKIQLIASNIQSVAQMTNSGAVPWNVFAPVDRKIQYFAQPNQGHYNTGPGVADGYAIAHLRSLYPTPTQLSGGWNNTWPVVAAYPQPAGVIGLSHYNLMAHTAMPEMLLPGVSFPINQTGRMHLGYIIQDYLTGRNSFYQPIRWPFQNANYLTKYNRRQLDSICLQILEITRGSGGGTDGGGNNESGFFQTSATIAPYGLTSGRPVMSATGRYPRLTRVIAKVDLFSRPEAFPRIDAATYYPGIVLDAGVPRPGTGYYDGATFRINVAFSLYLPRYLYESDNFVGQVTLNPDRTLPATVVGTGHALVDSTQLGATNQEPFGWNNGGLNEADWNYMVGSLPAQHWMDSLMYAESSADGTTFEPGNSSGIDFRGHPGINDDPDGRAPAMRRREYKSVTTDAGYPSQVTRTGYNIWSSGPDPKEWRPVVDLRRDPYVKASPVAGLNVNYSARGPDLSRKTRNLGTNIAKLRLKGGITLRLNHHGHANMVAPVDQILGPLYAGALGPGSTVPATIPVNSWQGITDWRTKASNAVIPLFRGTNGVEISLNQTLYVVAKTRDPMLGQLPGDWVTQIYTNSMAASPTNSAARRMFSSWPDWDRHIAGFGSSLNRQLGTYDYLPEPEWVDMAAEAGAMNVAVGQPSLDGQDEYLHPYEDNGVQKINIVRSGGGSWRSRLLNISKQRSFPSVGHLQYLRTGAMPDREAAQINDPDYAGMPFRCLNFGPANTQGGIPDWAMLDLFTVPNAIWTKPSSRFAYPVLGWSATDQPKLIYLTYGGASSGKINLNGSVLWPWAADADPAIAAQYVRPMPLAAQFNGLRYNRDGRVIREEFTIPLNIGGQAPPGSAGWMGNVGGNVNRMAVVTSTNSWRVVQPTEALNLSKSIADYIRANGPFSMPGQMCNVLPGTNGIGVTSFGAQIPTTSTNGSLLPPRQNGSAKTAANDDFYATGVHSGGINRTRNDIVSQSIGNLVTQGNVFAIWVVGQSIQKSPTSDPTLFEPDKGDKIVGETRQRILVERKLDPGVDGVYGNSKTDINTSAFTPGPAGPDRAVGTPDDFVDADYHPANPKFIYQVVNVREVQ